MDAPTSFTDPDFLDRLRKRDERAVQAVVHAYLPHILRAARGAGLADDAARETTQNVFVTFIEKLPGFEGRSHVRTWLFGILYRKLQETYRSRQREDRHDDIEEVVKSRFDARGRWATPPSPVDLEIEGRETLGQIADCLEIVPERQRLAFVLREVQGFTTEELCNVLQVSVTNLGVLLFRARNRLRECLESKGVKGSSGMIFCKDVARLVASGEFDDMRWWRRLEVNLHLLMCVHCRRYARQMRHLGRSVRKLLDDKAPAADDLDQLADQVIHRALRKRSGDESPPPSR